MLKVADPGAGKPPPPMARATLASGTWRSPPLPIICRAASATLTSAVAPTGLELSTPPEAERQVVANLSAGKGVIGLHQAYLPAWVVYACCSVGFSHGKAQ